LLDLPLNDVIADTKTYLEQSAALFSEQSRAHPANKAHDGKRRKLEGTVRDHPDYMVIGRKWYYAPAPEE